MVNLLRTNFQVTARSLLERLIVWCQKNLHNSTRVALISWTYIFNFNSDFSCEPKLSTLISILSAGSLAILTSSFQGSLTPIQVINSHIWSSKTLTPYPYIKVKINWLRISPWSQLLCVLLRLAVQLLLN